MGTNKRSGRGAVAVGARVTELAYERGWTHCCECGSHVPVVKCVQRVFPDGVKHMCQDWNFCNWVQENPQ